MVEQFSLDQIILKPFLKDFFFYTDRLDRPGKTR